MAMGTERSKALHNFTMPCGLRWGNPRILRCMRVNSKGQTSPLRRHAAGSSGGADHHRHHLIQQRRTTREREEDEFAHESPTKVVTTPSYGGRRFADDGDDGIAATREKVMLDLQTAADKMKDAIFKDGLEEGEVSASLPPPPPPPPAADAEGGEAYCPWNLRTRRAACRTAASACSSGGRSGGSPAVVGGSDGGGGKSFLSDAPRPAGSSQMRAAAASSGSAQKLPMHRSDGSAAAAASGEKREREKFSVALSKRDIEEDFYAMVGHRPPRRPKKRARIVQKQLDTLFPGFWLSEVTPDMYKVVEAAL